MRGHKKGCKCVGCSPATRKRGMAALKRRAKNPKRPSKKWFRKCVKAVKKSRTAVEPRKVCGALWHKKMSAAKKAKALKLENALRARKCCPHTHKVVAIAKRGQGKAKHLHRVIGKALTNPSGWFLLIEVKSLQDAEAMIPHYKRQMPNYEIKATVTKRGYKIWARKKLFNHPNPHLRSELIVAQKALKKELQRLRKIVRERGHHNPALPIYPKDIIGTSPVIHTDKGIYRFPSAKLVIGRYAHDFGIIASRRLHKAPIIGLEVFRLDYRNDAKAYKFYKRVGPFKHVFKERPIIASVIGGAGDRFTILFKMNSKAWRKA